MSMIAKVSLRALLVGAVLTAVALGTQPDSVLSVNGLSRNGIDGNGIRVNGVGAPAGPAASHATFDFDAVSVVVVALPRLAGTR